MNSTCILTKDLLPLYTDGLCSAGSAEIIKQHLAECADCKAQYETMQRDLPAESTLPGDPKKPFRKLKKRYVLRTLLAVLIVGALLFPAYVGVNTYCKKGLDFESIQAYRNTKQFFRDFDRQPQSWAIGRVFYRDFDPFDIQSYSLPTILKFTLVSAKVSLWDFSRNNNRVSGTAVAIVRSDDALYQVNLKVLCKNGIPEKMAVESIFGPQDEDGSFNVPLDLSEWRDMLTFSTGFPEE